VTAEAGFAEPHRFTALEAIVPGVVAGITAVPPGDGAGSESDFGLATGGSAWDVMRRYEGLARAVGASTGMVGRQVHGTRVVEAGAIQASGVHVVGEADGLMTSIPGILLAVTAADCVPVLVADVSGRCVALVHAGWRGAVAGMLEAAVRALGERFEVTPPDLAIFLGPAICGDCYEVGAEVLRAFGKSDRGPAGLDLRSELSQRAIESGVPRDRVMRSEWCTRCGPVTFHSHRGRGVDAGRMAAFLGLRGESPAPELPATAGA